MLSRSAIAILATSIFLSPVKAQTRGPAAGARGMGGALGVNGRAGFPRRGVVGGFTRFYQGRPFARGSVLWPYAYPYPYFDSDYGYDSGPVSPPQEVAVPASATAPASVAPPVEPLLIEWQGDHFVRMTLSEKASAEGQRGLDYSEKSIPRSTVPVRKDAVQPPRELPPAVLVFRDGRKEEVSSYTIMNGTIYSKADYRSGSWTRKIQIADLDVPATLKLNQEQGLKFELPAGPNEVALRL